MIAPRRNEDNGPTWPRGLLFETWFACRCTIWQEHPAVLRAGLRPYLALPREVYILCAGTFVSRAGGVVMPFLAIYLSKALGYDDAFVSLTIGMYGAGATLAYLIGGALADRVGRRPVMVVALLAGAVSLLVLSTLTAKASILGGTLIFALSMELYRPAVHAAVSEIVEVEARPRAFALLYVAINLGFAVGATAGGFVAKVAFEWLFYIDAACAAAFALIIFVAVQETRASATGEKEAEDTASNAEAIRHLVKNRAFMLFWSSTFFCALIFQQAHSSLPLYLSKLNLGPDQYGQVIAVNGVLIVLLQLPAAQWLARWSRAAVIGAGTVLTGAGFGLTGVFTEVVPLAFTVALWTLGEVMMAAFHSPIVSDLSPERFRARYFGVFAGAFGGSMMLGPVIGGFILQRFGAAWLWGGCLALSVIAASMLIPVWRELAAPDQRAAATSSR